MEQVKHAGGRPPKFKTPEELAEKADGYFQYCDTHPIEVWQRKAAAANHINGLLDQIDEDGESGRTCAE